MFVSSNRVIMWPGETDIFVTTCTEKEVREDLKSSAFYDHPTFLGFQNNVDNITPHS